MGRYDNEDAYSAPNMRQKDLVLSTNEFVFIQSKTNGQIRTHTGPLMVTISAQESMVVFNPKSKRFEETSDFEKARQLFTSAPEGWYIVLKNPAEDNSHPDPAKAMNAPALKIGKKINISGPCSFSLYPGQMAKVIQGHRLRSNQYLIARVYDADAASKSVATIVDAEGKEVESTTSKYFVGQLLVIKGTEVSFYMPPTGVEVLAVEDNRNSAQYVRDAVTLERLEYAILKDEDGEKRYVHGPAVVFPKPTEVFVNSPKGGVIFRALELSPISGIYVKVIADYEENGVKHKTGEELFITGNEQMIYYPRPEHALIQYDGKYMHHAIAIPEGEGRYILDRLNGKIKTVVGPTMYLPDPRTEVVVKRKLTPSECALFYPGNVEVFNYNNSLSEKSCEKLARKGLSTASTDAINMAYSTSNQLDSLAIFEANANISRGVSYTKPRTITLDTKYDGVVAIDVWTGYAINVISKSGKNEIVVGPTTRLLDYDETLQSFTTEDGKSSAFLKIENNKITSSISAQTKDFVDVQIKLSYTVDFLKEYKNKWFSNEDYSKYICDSERNLLKQAIKNYDIEEFYSKASDIIRGICLNLNTETDNVTEGRLFAENGMIVRDVEVLSVGVETEVAEMIEKHNYEMLEKNLELAVADARMKAVEAIAENEKKEAEIKNESKLYSLKLQQKYQEEVFEKAELLEEKRRAADLAKKRAECDLQELIKQLHKEELARKKAAMNLEIEKETKFAEIEKAKQAAYAETVQSIMKSIQPGLIEALSTKANSELLTEATKNMSAYALANGESVAETVDKLMRGTTLEGVLTNISQNK